VIRLDNPLERNKKINDFFFAQNFTGNNFRSFGLKTSIMRSPTEVRQVGILELRTIPVWIFVFFYVYCVWLIALC